MPCNLCGKWNCVCQYSQPKQQQEFTSCFFSREAMKEHSDFHPQPKEKQDEPVFHLKQYGDVTKEQLDCYIATGRIDTHPQPKAEEQAPVAWMMLNSSGDEISITKSNLRHRQPAFAQNLWKDSTPLYTAPQPRKPVKFPTMLRKMWSGGEVQDWLDEHVNKE